MRQGPCSLYLAVESTSLWSHNTSLCAFLGAFHFDCGGIGVFEENHAVLASCISSRQVSSQEAGYVGWAACRRTSVATSYCTAVLTLQMSVQLVIATWQNSRGQTWF